MPKSRSYVLESGINLKTGAKIELVEYRKDEYEIRVVLSSLLSKDEVYALFQKVEELL